MPGQSTIKNPLIINMPVRGVWITPNSPGTKVPSHSTNLFGEKYAIDFVMVNEKNLLRKPYKGSFLKYLFIGVPLSNFYGWGQPIYAPIRFKVIKMVNDVVERKIVNPISDLIHIRKATKEFLPTRDNIESMAGNYVLAMINNGTYVLLAHLAKGSIVVKKGDIVEQNQLVGKLGHSGNSTMPHLHMQFMSSPDFNVAKGIPFLIKEYEVRNKGKWEKVFNSIPTARDTIRCYYN